MLVTIKNGVRGLKLTKRERDTLDAARSILAGISSDYLDQFDEEERRDVEEARESMLVYMANANSASNERQPS